MLLSDAGAAILVESTGDDSDTGDTLTYAHWSDGTRYDSLIKKDMAHKFYMDGMGVFQFSITDVADSIKGFFDKTGIKREEIDYVVLHQAQKFIVDKVLMFTDIDRGKSLISYDKYANAGGASLPVTLCANHDCFDTKKKVLLCGFGVGLSWGINVF